MSIKCHIIGEDEYFDEGHLTLLIPQEIIKAIDQVIPRKDPLDDPDFHYIEYINSLFPSEQSLSNLEDCITELECKVRNLDDQIRNLVGSQTNLGKNGRNALLDAQLVIRKLFLQTLEIKSKAEQSEEAVMEITRDVKQLDRAKRNLTSAIITLNRLHVVVGGVDSLKLLTRNRQYGEIVMPLRGIVEVMKHFCNYKGISQIKQISDEVHEIEKNLSQQITQDFHDVFTGNNGKTFPASRNLSDACLVINILDAKHKQELLKWFVGIQLNEYLVLFNDSEDNAWLDKIDSRYSWLKKHLLQYEEKFSSLFPTDWELPKRIAIQFCKITKVELANIMEKRTNEIDAKLLLYAIQKTSSLEKLLALRITGNTLVEEGTSKGYQQTIKTGDKNDSKPLPHLFNGQQTEEAEITKQIEGNSPFNSIIGECFMPYLYIYIESVDRNLFEMMEKFQSDSKRDFNKDVPLTLVHGVLPSCADLFVHYKKILLQCNQLSNGPPMISLCNTFGKYLIEYAHKILQNNLTKMAGIASTSISTSVANFTKDFRDITSASSLINNFLKEGEMQRFTKIEISRICCILTTAEYCLETTQQLEEKLKEKVDTSLVNKVNFSKQEDRFRSIISNCIQLLVHDLQMACEPALSAMSKVQWHLLESVGDQSSYITAINSCLKVSIPFVKDSLSFSHKYFTLFCVRFANGFIPKFIQSLYKCKPLSPVGAEQLLLDTHMLKTALLDLPSIGCQVTRKAPASYTKVVVKGITRGEMILKVVMAPTEPDTAFVGQFLKLLPDSDFQEFQKILEMKGLTAEADRHQLISTFHLRSRFVTGFTMTTSSQEDTNIRKLNNLIRKNCFTGSGDYPQM